MTEETPQKKSNTGLLLLAIIVLSVIMCLIAGQLGDDDGGGVTERDRPETRTIVYSITGSSDEGSMTYENAQGNTEQGDYSIPFVKTFRMEPGSFAYISVQNNNKSGSVKCTIKLDGQDWQTATSEGAYKIATCSGIVP